MFSRGIHGREVIDRETVNSMREREEARERGREKKGSKQEKLVCCCLQTLFIKLMTPFWSLQSHTNQNSREFLFQAQAQQRV